MKRIPAFTLPLALFIIGFLALSVTQIYQRQNADINTLQSISDFAAYDRQTTALLQASLSVSPLDRGDISRKVVVLDGFYNLAHLVVTGALDTRRTDPRQLIVLQRILADCDVSPDLAQGFATALEQVTTYDGRIGILDVLAALDVSSGVQLQILACVRFSNPLNKVNLVYSTPQTVARLLEISVMQAAQILDRIQRNKITTIAELRRDLEQRLNKKIPIDHVQTLTISPDYDHAGVYWTQSGQTFAYVDLTRNAQQAWRDNWHILLWLPKDAV